MRYQATEEGLRALAVVLRHASHSMSASLAGSDPLYEETAWQGAVFRLVATAEATVDALANELTYRSVNVDSPATVLLVLEKERSGSANWRAREQVMKRHHGVRLSKCDDYKRLKAWIDVRNAIAHGLGELTTVQLMGGDIYRRLDLIGVPVYSRRIVLGERDVRACRETAHRFLLDLDSRAFANES